MQQEMMMSLQEPDTSRQAGARRELDGFLRSVELKAFRISMLACRNHDDALDIVQDAMFKLVKNYGHKSEEDWQKLFFRLLHTSTMDFHRKTVQRKTWFVWSRESDEGVEEFADEVDVQPIHRVIIDESHQEVLVALEALSVRQQQAFLFRSWQGMSVKETAFAMKCSEGSVKTHYHRAVKSLQVVLSEGADND